MLHYKLNSVCCMYFPRDAGCSNMLRKVELASTLRNMHVAATCNVRVMAQQTLSLAAHLATDNIAVRQVERKWCLKTWGDLKVSM